MSVPDRPSHGPVRFPARRIGDAPLVLPKGRVVKASDRLPPPPLEGAAHPPDLPAICDPLAPFSSMGSEAGATPSRSVAELERTLRVLEAKLEERERQLLEQEVWVGERQRELAETEALLLAREAMVAASRKTQSQGASRRETSAEELIAIERVRTELDRREASLRETRQSLLEREKFLDESEVRLFEKTQNQQEKESELEQWEEELQARERRTREAEALHDPALAAALKAEDEANTAKE